MAETVSRVLNEGQRLASDLVERLDPCNYTKEPSSQVAFRTVPENVAHQAQKSFLNNVFGLFLVESQRCEIGVQSRAQNFVRFDNPLRVVDTLMCVRYTKAKVAGRQRNCGTMPRQAPSQSTHRFQHSILFLEKVPFS